MGKIKLRILEKILAFGLLFVGLVIGVAIHVLISGCGGSSSPVVPSNVPIAIEGIGGSGDIPTDSVFTYTFSKPVNGATVNAETFFLVEGASCGAGNPVAATISCTSTVCTLTPSQLLTAGTVYTICLTTGIQYADGEQFAGTSATFVTASGGGAPAVSLVADGWSATVAATGTTNVNPSTMNITFTQAMNDASVTAAGNVALTCGLPTGSAVPQPTIVVTKHATLANTYTVNMADAYKYQLLACTLAVGTNVTNSSAVPLSSAATYQFQNGCAVSDDFNADSQGCWMVNPAQSTPWSTWEGLLANVVSFDTAGSSFDIDTMGQAQNTNFILTKSSTTQGESFELIMRIKSGVAGIYDGGDIYFYLVNERATEMVLITFGWDSVDVEGGRCRVGAGHETSGGPNALASAPCDDTTKEYYIKAVVENSWLTGYKYSTDGVNYADLTVNVGTFPVPINTSELAAVTVIVLDNQSPHDWFVPIHSFVLTGVTVEGQY